MATSHLAHTVRPGATRLPIGLFIVGLLAFLIASAMLAPRLGTLGQDVNANTIEEFGYGAGYPLHGGLAGPSRLSLQAEHDGYGTGYPLHGGLAGPSQVDEAQ